MHFQGLLTDLRKHSTVLLSANASAGSFMRDKNHKLFNVEELADSCPWLNTSFSKSRGASHVGPAQVAAFHSDDAYHAEEAAVHQNAEASSFLTGTVSGPTKNGCLHKTWPSIWVSNHVQFTFDGRSLLQLIMAFFDRVSEWREVQAFFRLQESVFLSLFFLREHPWTDPFLCHIPTTCRCRCWLGAKLWHRLWGVGDVEFKAPTIDFEILWNSDIAAHTVYTHADAYHHVLRRLLSRYLLTYRRKFRSLTSDNMDSWKAE